MCNEFLDRRNYCVLRDQGIHECAYKQRESTSGNRDWMREDERNLDTSIVVYRLHREHDIGRSFQWTFVQIDCKEFDRECKSA